LRVSRASSTSRYVSHENGAMLVNQGQAVSLLWQSKQAAAASSRVRDESHAGSAVVRGLV